MLDLHRPYNVYSNCILVNGISRSCIYDLQSKKYYFIPNDLYNILINKDYEKISDVLESFDKEHHVTIVSYFNFLFQNKLLFFCADNIFFTPLNTKYHSYSIIENAVIYFDLKINYCNSYLNKIVEIFNDLNVLSVQIVVENTNDDILNILSVFEKSCIVSMSLVFTNYIEKEIIYDIIKGNQRIFNVIVFLSQKDIYETVFGNKNILFTTISYEKYFNRVAIDRNLFTINLKYYIEAMRYNTFFNKKIFINESGYIYRFEKDNKSFGNILYDDVKKIINTFDYKYYMNVNKDLIDVCKVCEFRYMCYDSRIPIKKNNKWFYESDCGYNPYVAKWEGQEGYLSVEQWKEKC